MKKLALIAALVLASASAHASTYRSGRNTVVIPRGCYSWSCISVSVPGHYSHNVRQSPQAGRRGGKSTATVSTTPLQQTATTPITAVAPTAPAQPAAPVVATPAPQTAGSNITVLPAPVPAQQ